MCSGQGRILMFKQHSNHADLADLAAQALKEMGMGTLEERLSENCIGSRKSASL